MIHELELQTDSLVRSLYNDIKRQILDSNQPEQVVGIMERMHALDLLTLETFHVVFRLLIQLTSPSNFARLQSTTTMYQKPQDLQTLLSQLLERMTSMHLQATPETLEIICDLLYRMRARSALLHYYQSIDASMLPPPSKYNVFVRSPAPAVGTEELVEVAGKPLLVRSAANTAANAGASSPQSDDAQDASVPLARLRKLPANQFYEDDDDGWKPLQSVRKPKARAALTRRHQAAKYAIRILDKSQSTAQHHEQQQKP
jgi:hypothetical protein